MVTPYPVILDSFRCTTQAIRDPSFGSIYDPGLRVVKLLAVSFHDETPELVLNQTRPGRVRRPWACSSSRVVTVPVCSVL
jgi:hypothetical protein